MKVGNIELMEPYNYAHKSNGEIIETKLVQLLQTVVKLPTIQTTSGENYEVFLTTPEGEFIAKGIKVKK